MKPLVSAIIPTQNRPMMLREAAASVLGQTFRDLELIIVANAATPDTITAAQEIVRQDKRAHLIVRERGSLPYARNVGLSKACGEWVAYLDDDDLWLPTKIAKQLAEAERSGAALIGCGMVQFNRSGITGRIGAPIPAGLSLREALTVYNCLPGSASGALIRASAMRALGGFDESLRACEDWDMWRRICWHHDVSHVDEVLAHYRIHDQRMSDERRRMFRAELYLLMKITRDTPPHLRHMVRRAWSEKFWRESANIYAWANHHSGGVVQKVYRRIRSAVLPTAIR